MATSAEHITSSGGGYVCKFGRKSDDKSAARSLLSYLGIHEKGLWPMKKQHAVSTVMPKVITIVQIVYAWMSCAKESIGM